MPEELTAEQAAARLETADTLGMPLGPGQPPAFLRALGEIGRASCRERV